MILPLGNKRIIAMMVCTLMLTTLVSGCFGNDTEIVCGEGTELVEGACIPEDHQNDSNTVHVEFTLRAAITGYIGVGGEIEGIVNPDLYVPIGSHVMVTLINNEPMEHDFVAPALYAHSEHIDEIDESVLIEFTAEEVGSFSYYCSVPGHRQAGMEGLIIVGDGAEEIPPALPVDVESIMKNPTDVPPAINRNESATVHIELIAREVVAEVEPGVTYTFWTYDGTVPGPMLRARVGDTIVLHFGNDASSTQAHSIDLHAVTGPGGGAAITQTNPGEWNNISFKALNAGIFVYHCATPHVPTHISNGMYGLILIEPEAGLPEVEKEFYIMQGELYTSRMPHSEGHQEFDGEAMFAEQPTYVLFNGAFHGLTGEKAMAANINDTVRIYFGVGGPNLISSFHVIGEIFDRVYSQGDLLSEPAQSVQTTVVGTGAATVVEFQLNVAGSFLIVDHSLTRVFDKGALAIITVDGDIDPGIYNSNAEE